MHPRVAHSEALHASIAGGHHTPDTVQMSASRLPPTHCPVSRKSIVCSPTYSRARRKMDLSQLPDFRGGIEIRDISDGAIVPGRVDSQAAILVRGGEEFFGGGAQITPYPGALGGGLAVGGTIRCPLHHACFSLRSGAALR